MRPLALVAAVLLVVSACSGGPDEAEVVQTVTEQALVAGLVEAANAAGDLEDEVGRLCEDVGAPGMETAQAAWSEARVAWKESSLASWFGPADMLRTVSHVYYEPVDKEGIEELLVSGETLDPDYVANRAAATQRGLGTAEYLLYSDAGLEARRCELLVSVSAVAADRIEELRAAWADGYQDGPPFAESFAGEGMPSNDALGELVSAMVETVKQMSLFQIGKALGVSAPEPDVEAIPEGRSGTAAVSYRAQLESIRTALYEGSPTALGDLIAARSEEVAASIDAELDASIALLDEIEEPMRRVATEDPESLRPLYDHTAELLRLFESDVVSLLDITLGFSDTDGDSG